MTARPHWTRPRRRAIATVLGAALAAGLTGPASAQDTAAPPADAPETPAAAAIARLDFPAALEELGALIEADPTAAAPRLARADLHRRMQRPALAIGDLDAVLAADPSNIAARTARAEIWAARGAWDRALSDLDAALALRPDDAALLDRRAAILAETGDPAADATPEAAATATADAVEPAPEPEAAPTAPTPTAAERAAERIVFGEEALMSEAFRIEIGPDEAPDTLYIVHAATDLAADHAAFDPALIDRAVELGALRVVHMFTYTGSEASIWGNLGLICAGPKGFAAAHAALSDASGQAAVEAAGSGDTAPLERLLTAAYSVAGVAESQVADCALDRLQATRYLADWQAHREAGAWRGVNLLDTWPAWVLNDTPIGPTALAAKLAAMDPTTETRAETPAPSETPASPDPAESAGAGATPPQSTTPDPEIPEAPDAAPPPATAETDPAREDTIALATPSEDAAPPARPATAPVDPAASAAQAASDDETTPAPAPEDPPQPATPETPEAGAPLPPAEDTAPPPRPVTEDDTGPETAASGTADTATDGGATTAPRAETAPETSPEPLPDTPPVADAEDAPQTAAPAPPATAIPPAQSAGTTAPKPVRFPARPEPSDAARVPVDLRGIYAPSLAGCLAYLDAIEDPDRIDAVLPAINPLDGPLPGTILVTSRRVYLFNPADTECAIAQDSGSGNDWRGAFACASPLAPDAAPALALAPAAPDGTAPRLTATYAETEPAVLRQCRTLGQLGNIFAPLWTREEGACAVSVPVTRGRFRFSVDPDGDLLLRVAPDTLPADADAGRTELHAVIDGADAAEAPGQWDGNGWQVSLGPFASAAENLGWGMFLDTRATGDAFEGRLPLFGSSAAMTTLAACSGIEE